MAKFCSYCGKDISETGVCDCPESQAAKAKQENQYVTMTKNAFARMGELFLAFFRAPIATLRRAAHPDNMLAGILFYVAKALLTALCVTLVFWRLSSAVSFYFSIGAGTLIWTFFKMLLLSLVGDAAMVGLYFGAAKLLKGQGNFKALIGSMGTASIVSSCGLVVSMLFLWLLPTVGFAVAATVFVASLLYTAKAFAVTIDIQEEKRFFAILIATLVYALVAVLVLPSILGNMLGVLIQSSLF